MRHDLAELEEMRNKVAQLRACAKCAYEEVLAYFGETTNSTPSGVCTQREGIEVSANMHGRRNNGCSLSLVVYVGVCWRL